MSSANKAILRETPNWYVVTGAPSSGITTLVNALRPHVDKTVPEAARTLIDEARGRGIPATELRRDESEFQKKVLQMKLQIETQTESGRLTIFERGVPDSIPYFIIAGLNSDSIKTYARNRYKTVFYLELLPYEKDYARTETDDVRTKLSRLLYETYTDLGYRVIRIPPLSIPERVRLVLSHLNEI